MKNLIRGMRQTLSYLHGMKDSDGCLSKTQNGAYTIQLGAKDIEYVKKTKEVLEQETGEEVNLHHYQKDTVDGGDFYQINKANKELFNELNKTDREDAQPGPYLRAMWDGDGAITKKPDRKTAYDLRVRITNPEIADNIKDKLLELGITEENINTRESKPNDIVGKRIYEVKVSAYEGRLKFAKKAGFDIPRKQQNLIESFATPDCIICGESAPKGKKKYCSHDCKLKQDRLKRRGEGVTKEPEYSVDPKFKRMVD